jgi:hypothetical protein
MIGRKVTAACFMSAAVALMALAVAGSASAHTVCMVPELDPQTFGAGLVILGGAAAMLLERYRRRKA